jgi:PAS domain S-box-containing protein
MEFNVSHAYLFEKHSGPAGEMVNSMRYEWVAPGQKPDLDDPAYQNASEHEAEFKRYYETLTQGEPFVGSSSLLLERERAWLNTAGIKALLEMRIVVNGMQWGTLGFDDTVDEREWTVLEVDVLKVAANVLGAAIKRQLDEDALKRELAERRRLERELQEERDFALQVITSLGQGLTVTNAEGRFLLVNPAFAHLIGYEPDELIGKNPSMITVSESQEVLKQARLDRRMGIVSTYESTLIHRNGQAIPVLVTGAPRLKDGKYAGSISSVTDLTQIKWAQEERERLIAELSAKNAELEQFTYTVSHDLKSPLVTINGFLGFLEQDAVSGNMERLKKDSQRIHEAVQKMKRLLNELLELSRIGRMMNAPRSIPFNELVDEARALVQGRLEERGVTIHTQADLPVIYGDRPRLIEVLQNLIDNAAKYMGGQKNPRIEIGQHGEENGLPVFFVRDNGMGIEPEHHERVFGLFNKLDAKSEGTGVGLALVRRIIEFHGGRVWVESEAGMGSTFLFTLPTGPVA